MRHFVIALFVIIVGFTTISCSKKKLNQKLEGTWERIDFREPSASTIPEYWIFEDNVITIKQDLDYNGNYIQIDQASYSLKIKLETKEFVAKGFGEGVHDGQSTYRKNAYNTKWIIDKLEDDVLSIYADKDDNFVYFDFIKVE